MKRWVVFIALTLVLSIMLMACSNKNQADQTQPEQGDNTAQTANQSEEVSNLRPTVLYYQDADGYVIPVMRKIPWQEAIARAALTAITDQPTVREDMQKIGLLPPVPADTKINGISIHDGVATVDFNDGIMNCANAAEERSMVDAIVHTLAEFPTIDKVQFQVNGKVVKKLKYGTPVDKPLEPSGINVETADSKIDLKNASKVIVYFCKAAVSNFAYLVPVTRYTSASSPNIAEALNQLLKGPKEGSNLNTAIPAGTKLLGVQVEDGIAYINLSKEFQAADSGDANMDMALKQIMMTVRQFDGIQKVKVQVEGKDMVAENDAAQPLAIPTFANEY